MAGECWVLKALHAEGSEGKAGVCIFGKKNRGSVAPSSQPEARLGNCNYYWTRGVRDTEPRLVDLLLASMTGMLGAAQELWKQHEASKVPSLATPVWPGRWACWASAARTRARVLRGWERACLTSKTGVLGGSPSAGSSLCADASDAPRARALAPLPCQMCTALPGPRKCTRLSCDNKGVEAAAHGQIHAMPSARAFTAAARCAQRCLGASSVQDCTLQS